MQPGAGGVLLDPPGYSYKNNTTTMSKPDVTYALMATLAGRLNYTSGVMLCLIAKRPDNSLDVYLNNVPTEGPELHKAVDDLKEALKKLQETIKHYEDKFRNNG